MRRALVLLAAALGTAVAVAGGSAATRQVLAVPWSGTLDGNGVVAGTQTCSGTWQGKLTLSVAGTTVTGSGSVDVGNPACSLKLPTPDLAHVDFTLTGTKDSTTSGDTRFTLFMHGQSVSPSGSFYDPSGFLLHFGQANEGIPLVLIASGGRIDQKIENTVPIQNATVTLSDHFVLKSGCDPDLLGKALREFDIAQTYYDAGVKEFNQAIKDFRKFGLDYGEEFGRVAGEKYAILKDAEIVDEAIEGTLTPAQAGLVGSIETGLEGGALVGGLAITLKELLNNVIPAFKEHSRLLDEADADFKSADQWNKRAAADLKDALASGPCLDPVEEQLNKALDEQRVDQQARSIIDSWENTGYLYKNPATGEILDEAAALKAALATLKGRSLQVVGDDRSRLLSLDRRLHTALKLITRSQSFHAKAKGHLAKILSSTQRARTKLSALLNR